MYIETLSFHSPFSSVVTAAKLESGVLLEEVMAKRLPTIDLHLPKVAERIARTKEIGLINHITETRLQRMFDDFSDPMRTTFVAIDNEETVGIGRVRIRPELNTTVLYGFNIRNDKRTSPSATSILEQCLEIIEQFSNSQTTPTQVRINRYQMTEQRKPAISNMANRINSVYGDGIVAIEQDDWEGEPFIRFTTSFMVFSSLFDRYADKIATFI